ncbi:MULTISPECIES: bestrophin-like domain [Saccharothrix]|uniref:bestrophin-like domain n=1 Tax=Saccharothrix TaxID=2071 RepID=UPI00093F6433|nr:DUF4239 domain-containing protein [Saccharothrix sp. CB00851]OKI13886.1 hypothetical protein A6A25_16585 [Saccharothrix sp. CB00851]
MITTIAAAVCALALGLFFNWLLKRRRHLEPGGEPITTSDLTSPMETLAVLLLAFVLVVAAESYSAADEAVRSEAVVVEHLFEFAEFAPEPAAQTLQGATICYTRAVLAHEWAQMEEGSGLSPVPSVWSDRFRQVLKELGAADPLFETLVNADERRSEARMERIAQSAPAIPEILYWFMVISLAVTVVAFAFNLPSRRGGLEIATLVVLTTLFTLCLLLIQDVDRPFAGVISVSTEALHSTEDYITEGYDVRYDQETLPCDQAGGLRAGA